MNPYFKIPTSTNNYNEERESWNKKIKIKDTKKIFIKKLNYYLLKNLKVKTNY